MIAGLPSGLTPHDSNQGDHRSMHVDLMKVAVVSISFFSRLEIDPCFNVLITITNSQLTSRIFQAILELVEKGITL